MRLTWQLATRNWSASPVRVAATVLSVALGVACVTVITSFYETSRQAIQIEVVDRWLGAADLAIYPPGAHRGALPEALAEAVADVPGVDQVTVRLVRRLVAMPVAPTGRLAAPHYWRVDAVGIRPDLEQRFRTWPGLEGRLLEPGDRNKALIERQVAQGFGLSVGDPIALALGPGSPATEFEIVGVFASPLVAEFRHPEMFLPIEDVQQLTSEPGAVSAVDIRMKEATPVDRLKAEVSEAINSAHPAVSFQVDTAEGKRALLDQADRITRMLLMLVAFVAMLTSFFIILTTMSVSLVERRASLGAMRCVGMTRAGMCGMLSLELLPLGAAGSLLGLLLGWAVVAGVEHFAAEYIGQVVVSRWGLGLAVLSGLTTTAVAAAILFLQVGRVSPVEALRTEARPARRRVAVAVALAGLALLVFHEWLVRSRPGERWLEPAFASAGAGSLYFAYVLLTPGLVVIAGSIAAGLAGQLLGIDARLARDQFGKSPWRATGSSWMLMVGLSITVYLAIGGQAILAVWDFPGRLPEAFVWVADYVPGERARSVAELEGVERLVTVTDVNCEAEPLTKAGGSPGASLIAKLWQGFRRPVFVAGDPVALLGMIEVEFVEGTRDDALRKLDQGGHILLPAQAALHLRLAMGDRVEVTIEDRSATFEVAGVVQSPVLDLAVTAFQATSYMQLAAASAILGTQADLVEKFGIDSVSMLMFDTTLAATPPPPAFAQDDPDDLPGVDELEELGRRVLEWQPFLPEEQSVLEEIQPAVRDWLEAGASPDALPADVEPVLRRFAGAVQRVQWAGLGLSAEDRWSLFRERLLLLKAAHVLHRPEAISGSLQRLHEEVDRNVRQSIATITWLPSILLIAAMLGVANLMNVSVQLRARQIAVLRAVGALKSQVARMILAEALAIAVVGSTVGLALGMHQGYSDNRVTAELIGFYPTYAIPWATTALAVGVVVAACLLAGLPAALRASRSNVSESLQSA